jgi:hypothetical protein
MPFVTASALVNAALVCVPDDVSTSSSSDGRSLAGYASANHSAPVPAAGSGSICFFKYNTKAPGILIYFNTSVKKKRLAPI